MPRLLKWYSFRGRVFVPVVLIIAAGLGYFGWRVHLVVRVLPTGQGPAGTAIPIEPFQSVWSDKTVVLLGVGDSVTRGYGADQEHSFFALLQKNDDMQCADMAGRELAAVFPNIEAYNYAVDFTTSQYHLDKQLPLIPAWPDDVAGIIVITTGGNDLIHDYGRSAPKDGAMYGCSYEQALVWTENVKQRIGKLLEGLVAGFEGSCEIFLANIYDPTDGLSDPYIVGFPRWSEGTRVVILMNKKIAELCDSYQNVHLVDIHSEFLGHGIHCTEWWRKHYKKDDPHYWYARNFEDPNPRGHDAIRRLFLLKMAEVLPARLSKRN